MTVDYAARARELVGARFRPQGRGAEGIDCVGVVLTTFGIAPANVRSDYRLRGVHEAEVLQSLGRYFRRVRPRELRAGDVMALRVRGDQSHLAVRTESGFVHAHAGIGRVVETPGMPEWPLIGVYRKRKGR